jgi:hypothetical protein
MSRLPLRSLLLALGALCASCSTRETPIPHDKQAFVGTWTARTGFTLVIDSSGFANVIQTLRPELPDSENLSIKVAGPIVRRIQVHFPKDRTLRLIAPHLYARDYRITRAPYQAEGRWRLVLDGVVLERTP